MYNSEANAHVKWSYLRFIWIGICCVGLIKYHHHTYNNKQQHLNSLTNSQQRAEASWLPGYVRFHSMPWRGCTCPTFSGLDPCRTSVQRSTDRPPPGGRTLWRRCQRRDRAKFSRVDSRERTENKVIPFPVFFFCKNKSSMYWKNYRLLSIYYP